MIVTDEELINQYLLCLREVLLRGWVDEIRGRREAKPNLESLDHRLFFKHYAICVFQPRYKWEVLKKKIPALAKAFRDWDFEDILKHRQEVESEALKVIPRKRNVGWVLQGAQELSEFGWDNFNSLLLWGDPSQKLRTLDALPGIGAAEKYELARAVQLDVGVKPDTHWLKFASEKEYPRTEEGVQQLGKRIAQFTGEREGTVDYVIWRFREGSRNCSVAC